MLSPHPEKWGGGTRPPRPPPIDARGNKYVISISNSRVSIYVTSVYYIIIHDIQNNIVLVNS